MQEKYILCCLNNFPLFEYVPLDKEDLNEQYILNYVTNENFTKWYQKEQIEYEQYKLIYVEIDLKKALQKIKNKNYKPKEKMYVFFFEFCFQEYPHKISYILKKTNALKPEELIELPKKQETIFKTGKKKERSKINFKDK